MSELSAENLRLGTTDDDDQIICEPSYAKYLRTQGYAIESVIEAHTVPSESSKGKAHLVLKVETYEFPHGDPRLDVVEHETELWMCDCWDYRSNSADVSEPNTKPTESKRCKHVRRVSREERAKQDPNQDTLTADN